MNDLVNKRFGDLVVISYGGRPFNKYVSYWLCKCDCGKETNVRQSHLLNGNTKSCGCRHNRKGKDSPFFKGIGELPLDYFSVLRRNSKGGKRKPKEFSITMNYIWQLFLNQNRKCALSGIEIGFGNPQTASLDRIDSSKGYVNQNVQWVHKDINIMKNDLDTKTFLRYCFLVNENQSGRNR